MEVWTFSNFLSGFGLYIGYKGTARYFYIRRFARIYPTYLLCAFLAYWQRGDFNPIRPIIASTGIGYYLPGFHIPIIDWYIPTMYLLYLLFPWFVSVEKIEPGGAKSLLKRIVLAIVVGLLLTIVLIVIQKGTIILTTSRIPIFFIGVFCGYLYKIKYVISNLESLLLICISLIALIIEMYMVSVLDYIILWRYAIFFLPFAVITPGQCFALSWCMSHLHSLFSTILGFIGNISLEIYLLHVLLLNYWKEYMYDLNLCHTTFSFILFMIIVVLCSYIISLIVCPITKYLRNIQYAK